MTKVVSDDIMIKIDDDCLLNLRKTYEDSGYRNALEAFNSEAGIIPNCSISAES
jgi:hypothetical protein